MLNFSVFSARVFGQIMRQLHIISPIVQSVLRNVFQSLRENR